MQASGLNEVAYVPAYIKFSLTNWQVINLKFLE